MKGVASTARQPPRTAFGCPGGRGKPSEAETCVLGQSRGLRADAGLSGLGGFGHPP